MNETGIQHILWITVVITNFVVQLLYFFNDRNRLLFVTKKITTPLLLFGGLAVVIASTRGFPIIPGIVLLTMGLGELGIEGSTVVESKADRNRGTAGRGTPWTVTAAGVLFLLVNLFLGITLLIRIESLQSFYLGTALGFGIVIMMVLFVIIRYRPPVETRTLILMYSAGLAILAAGAFSNLFGGIGTLGRAALVLTVSDSLVLIRMGGGWNKDRPSERWTLMGFLVIILLLYYLFIALLVGMTAPFRV
jgi:hypothetical protein